LAIDGGTLPPLLIIAKLVLPHARRVYTIRGGKQNMFIQIPGDGIRLHGYPFGTGREVKKRGYIGKSKDCAHINPPLAIAANPRYRRGVFSDEGAEGLNDKQITRHRKTTLHASPCALRVNIKKLYGEHSARKGGEKKCAKK
jgi:hypothetical protein